MLQKNKIISLPSYAGVEGKDGVPRLVTQEEHYLSLGTLEELSISGLGTVSG